MSSVITFSMFCAHLVYSMLFTKMISSLLSLLSSFQIPSSSFQSPYPPLGFYTGMCLTLVQSPHGKPPPCSFLPRDLCTYCSLALSQDTHPPWCPFLFTCLVIPGPPVNFRLWITLSGKPDLTVKLKLFLPGNVFSWNLSCRHFRVMTWLLVWLFTEWLSWQWHRKLVLSLWNLAKFWAYNRSSTHIRYINRIVTFTKWALLYATLPVTRPGWGVFVSR